MESIHQGECIEGGAVKRGRGGRGEQIQVGDYTTKQGTNTIENQHKAEQIQGGINTR